MIGVSLYIPIVSVVIGGATTLAGAFLANRSNDIRLQRQLLAEREKDAADSLRLRGEELYLLVQRWLLSFASPYLNVRSVMEGKITYNQALEAEIASMKSLEGKFEVGRMELLIDVYFSQVQKDYLQVWAAVSSFAILKNAHKAGYKAGKIRTELITDWNVAISQIEEAGDIFKRSIIREIRAIK